MSTFSPRTSLETPRVLKFVRLRAYLSSPTSQIHKTPQFLPAVQPSSRQILVYVNTRHISPPSAFTLFSSSRFMPMHCRAPLCPPLPSSFQSQTSVFFFSSSSVPKPQNVCHPHPPLLLFSPLSSTSHLGFSLIPAFFLRDATTTLSSLAFRLDFFFARGLP